MLSDSLLLLPSSNDLLAKKNINLNRGLLYKLDRQVLHLSYAKIYYKSL